MTQAMASGAHRAQTQLPGLVEDGRRAGLTQPSQSASAPSLGCTQ